MFFNTWYDVWRVMVVGVLVYVALVTLLRISGKRTLAKMNAFDLVVTVALGSTLASALLSKQVSVAEGVTGLAVLIVLQYAIAWLSVRVGWFRRAVRSEPALLLYRGEFLSAVMKRQRVSEQEVRQAIRTNGAAKIEDVEAVVLETDGTFSVLGSIGAEKPTALADVAGRHEGLKSWLAQPRS